MKTGLNLYKFHSPEMHQLARKCVLEKNRVVKAGCDMAEKYGGTGDICFSNGIIRGFYFAKLPDTELWCRMDPRWPHYYRPRGARLKSKKLYEEFKNLPRWSTKGLAEQLKWRDFHVDTGQGYGNYYMFNFFYDHGKKFYGIAFPQFSPSVYKKNPEAKYVPPKGMKKITPAQYERVMGTAWDD